MSNSNELQQSAHNHDVEENEEIKSTSPWKHAINQLIGSPFALAGFGIVIFFILLGLFAPLITSFGYEEQFINDRLQAPSAKYWLGTDNLGRDIFYRLAYGARISMIVGFVAVTGALILGTILGIISGYYGGWIDMVISRFFDIMLAFPSILLAIAVVSILGPSLQNALIAISIVEIPIFGRLVRSRVISIREEEYIMAARAQGRSEEHTSELQSRGHLVCRLLLE